MTFIFEKSKLKQLRPLKNMKENNKISEPEPQPKPLLLDIRAAARALSMSVVSIRKLIRQGRLKRLENFRKILIPISELERFAVNIQ